MGSLELFHTIPKEMATHTSILAWRIPGTEEPGGTQSMGLQRDGHDWVTKHTRTKCKQQEHVVGILVGDEAPRPPQKQPVPMPAGLGTSSLPCSFPVPYQHCSTLRDREEGREAVDVPCLSPKWDLSGLDSPLSELQPTGLAFIQCRLESQIQSERKTIEGSKVCRRYESV